MSILNLIGIFALGYLICGIVVTLSIFIWFRGRPNISVKGRGWVYFLIFTLTWPFIVVAWR